MRFKNYYLILLFLFIAGCATSEKHPTLNSEQQHPDHIKHVMAMSHWVLTGRLSIRNAEENWSGTVRWSQQHRDHFEFHFSGPLGQGAVLIKGNDRGVVLKASDGSVLFGQSVAELVYQRLGWDVPFKQLTHWVKGVPEPAGEKKIILDDFGRIAELVQSQWSIRYKAYEALDDRDVVLPKKVYLKKAPWQIKLIIDEWQYRDDGQS